MSGHGLYAQGFELDVIASVVMGGTPLSGGSGYVFGTLFGVLVNVVIQTIIQFNGQLSSWWTKIVIAALTLMFIGVQSYMLARRARRSGGSVDSEEASKAARRQRLYVAAAVAGLVVVLTGVMVSTLCHSTARREDDVVTGSESACQDKPFRQDQAARLLEQEDPVIIYEKNGGANCVDELYVIYGDGRIVGDNGSEKVEKQTTGAEVEKVVSAIVDLGWFTDEMYDTWHTRCGECYGYFITVSHEGQVKTVKGVDGGTDAPAKYWSVASLISGIVPHFPSSSE
jgi:hypothetical protein